MSMLELIATAWW